MSATFTLTDTEDTRKMWNGNKLAAQYVHVYVTSYCRGSQVFMTAVTKVAGPRADDRGKVYFQSINMKEQV